MTIASVASASVALAVVDKTPQSALGHNAVVAARALLEKSGSFHSMDAWFGISARRPRRVETPHGMPND